MIAKDVRQPRASLAGQISTLDLEATGEGATLRLTVQIVSLAGPGMIAGF
jgi:hypothetical protein